MGALHEGHLSLVKEARSCNDIVIASVFVNPTQFGEGEDLDKYPRQLERDAELLGDCGVDHIFTPNCDDMYGKNYGTYVDCKCFDDIPESIARPGHFRGVATIVTKLFNIVQPTNAYFGQKDAGQCVLIRRIVEDLNMDVNVVVMDTIRESDGLAKSSRNEYLSESERKAATIIYKSLTAAKELITTNPSASSSDIIDVTRNILNSEPLVSEIQYISVESMSTMEAVSQPSGSKDGTTISLACVVGSVRLIDNIVLTD
ncbi:pantoate--beta-alanine ligase [Fragilariopsis cylindrus CCMP1102]|uniref:Pantoate--beta-alanine ligase n=1 Tax=Fragilariopsis cylindrus CCMP1102 TaxID=635003 RepID=A0A1E7FKY2_9STRA|nr:pantoate--beta-alanine ligase [Fragilariopsis cylindrus CCMP1102]|eukprot:OEU18787.1 pantoate--beta-alanine ligase [Fragilariopsis cylindrus CCMP1102]